ncbi:hypothetical protein CL628_04610 [bacterium]|nr:hypothetical protein [bacterium]
MPARLGLVLVVTVAVLAVAVPVALAHRSGCHNLHTCVSDTDTYVCGDLGYPCNGATSLKDFAPGEIVVPLLVEATFEKIFGRAPTLSESMYWKQRFRDDKGSLTKIRRAMRWHNANGSFGPAVATVLPGATTVSRINALFRAANNGRNPTVSENLYWQSRIPDKPTEVEMQGAMAWHRLRGIAH